MVIRSYPGNVGQVQVQVLKWPSRVPFPQYHLRNDPNGEVYIPVRDGDKWAIKMTLLENFHMGRFSQVRCNLYHAGMQTGPVRMVEFDCTDNLKPDGSNRLASNMTEIASTRAYCKINGVKYRDLQFAVAGLIPDPSLSQTAETKGKASIEIKMYRFKKTVTYLRIDEAKNRHKKNRSTGERIHDNSPAEESGDDQWVLDPHTDPKSWEDGVRHTPNLVEGIPVKQGRRPAQKVIYDDEWYGKRKKTTSNDRDYKKNLFGIKFRFAPIEYLENGDFVEIDDDHNVQVENFDDDESDYDSDAGADLDDGNALFPSPRQERIEEPFEHGNWMDDDVEEYVKGEPEMDEQVDSDNENSQDSEENRCSIVAEQIQQRLATNPKRSRQDSSTPPPKKQKTYLNNSMALIPHISTIENNPRRIKTEPTSSIQSPGELIWAHNGNKNFYDLVD